MKFARKSIELINWVVIENRKNIVFQIISIGNVTTDRHLCVEGSNEIDPDTVPLFCSERKQKTGWMVFYEDYKARGRVSNGMEQAEREWAETIEASMYLFNNH